MNVTSQTVFYQDICNCGVTAGGFSAGGGASNGTVELYIEPGSTIRKAFLMAFSVGEKTIKDRESSVSSSFLSSLFPSFFS
nr:hypothetical protein [uncultured Brumimicrobium sp.]